MRINTKSMAFTALLAAIICALSPWSVMLGPIPLSFGSLAIYIASCLLDKKHGTVAVTVFVALGAFGVPVFTGFTGGFAKIAGPTGGYIIGYIFCALVIGLLVDALEKRIWAYPVAMIAGTAVLYAFGTAWFVFQSGADWLSALAVCVLPFLIGDAIKIVVATALCFKLRFLLKKLLGGSLKRKRKKPAADIPVAGDFADGITESTADEDKTE